MKEKIIIELINEPNQQYSKSTLKKVLNIKNEDSHLFNVSMSDLMKDGVLNKDENHLYSLVQDTKNILIGYYHNNVVTSLNGLRNISIKKINNKNILNGDIVLTSVYFENGVEKAEGEILSILKRKEITIKGTYIEEENKPFGFVVPDVHSDADIYISKKDNMGANSYEKVIVKINEYPSRGKNPQGVIVTVLGVTEDIKIDYTTIVQEYNLRETFPAKVLQQVERFPDNILDEELTKRKDLSNMCIFTIDGEDSMDLDDAISLEKVGTEYRLGVHIADVTHFVKEYSPLDKEALARGTSIYLINKVLPMLPKKLSNGLCSLNPFQTKLTLSVFMTIDSKGDVVKHEICESFIESKSKLCYGNVSNFLENKDELKCSADIDEPMKHRIEKSLKIAEELQRILQGKRLHRGAIDFQFDESKITLDNDYNVLEVKPYERRIANRLIEEFMIITNETVAEHYCTLNLPFVYRVHEKPRDEKMQMFLDFVKSLDYELPEITNDTVSVKILQKILEDAKGKDEAEAINLLLLRSMQQAKYMPDELGHFGLGSTYYSHFTSPIRRYPDLQIHRIIKEDLNGKLNKMRIDKLKTVVKESSDLSSKREREAQKAEISYENMKKAEFMELNRDVEFEGTISEISRSICRVSLPNTIDGTIDLKQLDLEFAVVKEGYSLKAITSGVEIRVGTKVRVKVLKTNPIEEIITFTLLEVL